MQFIGTMRDEEDPKSPRPLGSTAKGQGHRESAEAEDWREVRPGKRGADHDRHRHVSC